MILDPSECRRDPLEQWIETTLMVLVAHASATHDRILLRYARQRSCRVVVVAATSAVDGRTTLLPLDHAIEGV